MKTSLMETPALHRRWESAWILGLGLLIPLSIGLAQETPAVISLLMVVIGLLCLPLFRRTTHLMWLLIPLAWFHHSSTTMILGWMCFMVLLWLDLQLRSAAPVIRLPEHPWLLLVSVATLLLSVAHGGPGIDVFGQWIWDFGILLLYILITRVSHDAVTVRRFIVWLLCVIGVSGLTVTIEGVLNPGNRATGLVDVMPTGAAYNLAMFVPLALGAIRGTRLGLLAGLIAAVLFAAVFYTGSRAPFVAVLLACLPFVMQYRFSLLSAGAALTTAVVMSGGGLVSRVEGFKHGNMLVEVSTLTRLVMWVLAIEVIRDKPWTGIGLGRFGELVVERLPLSVMRLGHPHNTLLNKMVQVGIPLSLLFFSIVGWILLRNFRLYRAVYRKLDARDSALTLGLLMVPWPMLICGVTDAIFNGYAQPFLMWTMLAVQTIWMRMMNSQYGTGGAHAR